MLRVAAAFLHAAFGERTVPRALGRGASAHGKRRLTEVSGAFPFRPHQADEAPRDAECSQKRFMTDLTINRNRLFTGCIVSFVAAAFGFAERAAILENWRTAFNVIPGTDRLSSRCRSLSLRHLDHPLQPRHRSSRQWPMDGRCFHAARAVSHYHARRARCARGSESVRLDVALDWSPDVSRVFSCAHNLEQEHLSGAIGRDRGKLDAIVGPVPAGCPIDP